MHVGLNLSSGSVSDGKFRRGRHFLLSGPWKCAVLSMGQLCETSAPLQGQGIVYATELVPDSSNQEPGLLVPSAVSDSARMF